MTPSKNERKTWMASAAKKIVIVDTDPGVDDAMALLLLSNAAGIEINAMTTVFGNADVDTTTRNAAYLVNRFELDIPVFRGAHKPLSRERVIPQLRVHGMDGFGDTNLASKYSYTASAIPASEYIVETIRRHPGKVSLLALAPLTNLALALREAPDIADLVDQVIVMGGAFGYNGRNGNITPNAEANIYYDPDAAKTVFDGKWPVTAVGLDVTSGCVLSSQASRMLADKGGDAGKFLWEISRGYEEIYRSIDGIDGCCIHDVAAAAYLLNPAWFKTKNGAVSVDTFGDHIGKTTISTHSSGDRPAQKVCCEIDAAAVVSSYIQAIDNIGGVDAIKESRNARLGSL